jgi:hypothetical protein
LDFSTLNLSPYLIADSYLSSDVAGMTLDYTESGKAAKRVAIIVSKRSPHWLKAWASSDEVIAIALKLVHEEGLIEFDAQNDASAVRVLAKERWDLRTYIVFDVFHHTYEPDNAHLRGQNDLPVISVFLGAKECASVAATPMANKVNKDIRTIHDATGPGSRPPFVVDHKDGKVPFYSNPRSCKNITS